MLYETRKIDHQNLNIQAYLTANWTRAKRMPPYRKIMKNLGIDSVTKEQTQEEQLRIVEMLNAAYGGQDLRKDKN